MSAPIQRIAAWIRERHPQAPDFGADDDLIDSRLIDSLGFMEFLILLEKVSGTPVDVDALNIEDLRTLNRIEARFFPG